MQTNADTDDTLADLDVPQLRSHLAQYLGAVRLRELGTVDDAYVKRRLQLLRVTCGAAETLLRILARPALERQRTREAPGVN